MQVIVVTTINPPNDFIKYYSRLKDWRLVVVADNKTNVDSYKDVDCELLTLERQHDISPDLYNKVPFNSYARKMFGYLWAIRANATNIFDTDDDNLNLLAGLKTSDTYLVTNVGLVNIYQHFTDARICPRGIPQQCMVPPICCPSTTNIKVSVIQGLVDGDPDVNAVWRMCNDGKFSFTKNLNHNLILGYDSICPFNSQNTLWVDPAMYYCMYLPTTVSFRYTDILRGYVALVQLQNNCRNLMFTPPTAYQVRNHHNLLLDLKDEITMYETVEIVANGLDHGDDLLSCYERLVDMGVVDATELNVLKAWYKALE